MAAVEGERIPGVADSQKLIRSAVIVVYDRLLTDIELAYYDYIMREYEKSSGSTLGLTFAEATGGRATLDTALPCVEGMASLNCVSVPAVSVAGLAVIVVALLGAGVIVIARRGRLSDA